MRDWLNILAARDEDRGSGKWILPLVIFAFIILGKIMEWLKKRQEEAKQRDRQQQPYQPLPSEPPEAQEEPQDFEVEEEEEEPAPPPPPAHRYRPIPQAPPPMPHPQPEAPSPMPSRRPAPSAAPVPSVVYTHREVGEEDLDKVDEEVERKRRLLEEKLQHRAARLAAAAPAEADTAAIESKLLHVRPAQAASMAKIAGVTVDLHDPRIALRGILFHEIFSPPKALRNTPEMWEL